MLLAPASASPEVPRAMRESYPFIRFDRTGHTGELIERTPLRLRAKPQEFLELNSIGSIVELVREGPGVAVLPSVGGRAWAAEPLLQVIAIPQAAESREIALVQLRTAPRAEIIMAMGQHFVAALAESAKGAAMRPSGQRGRQPSPNAARS